MGAVKGALETSTFRFTRKVWALVTKNPRITLRELMAQTGGSYCRCRHAVRRLERLGYVDHPPYASRAIRVLVPFGEQVV